MQETDTSIPRAVWSWRGLSFEFQCENPAVVDSVQRVVQRWSDWTRDTEPQDSRSGQICRAVAIQAEPGWHFRGNEPGADGLCHGDAELSHAVEADAAHSVIRSCNDLTVHGALVSSADFGMLVLGPSHSGKSTLACGLWKSGWKLHSDDVTLLLPDAERHSTRTIGLPRRISLRSGSEEQLGGEFWKSLVLAENFSETRDGILFHAPAQLPRYSPRLRLIVLVDKFGAGEDGSRQKSHANLRLLDPADALLAVAPYTNIARFQGLGASLAALSPLIEKTPAIVLPRAGISDMTASLEQMHTYLEQQK